MVKAAMKDTRKLVSKMALEERGLTVLRAGISDT